jgi:hypothetical protein
VIAPSPSDVAPTLGVTGESLNDSDVLVGAHVTVWGAFCTEIVIALLVADAYIASAVTLDVTEHEPTADPVRVELAIEQYELPEATAYVT